MVGYRARTRSAASIDLTPTQDACLWRQSKPTPSSRSYPVDLELPKKLTDYLAELDDFIEREIKPLENENDNIRFFDHRRENSRADGGKERHHAKDWKALLSGVVRRADTAGHYRYHLPKAYGGRAGSDLDM